MNTRCKHEIDAKNLIDAQFDALMDVHSKLQESSLAETKEKLRLSEENKLLKTKLSGYEDLVRRVEEKEGGINECYREVSLFTNNLTILVLVCIFDSNCRA